MEKKQLQVQQPQDKATRTCSSACQTTISVGKSRSDEEWQVTALRKHNAILIRELNSLSSKHKAVKAGLEQRERELECAKENLDNRSNEVARLLKKQQILQRKCVIAQGGDIFHPGLFPMRGMEPQVSSGESSGATSH